MTRGLQTPGVKQHCFCFLKRLFLRGPACVFSSLLRVYNVLFMHNPGLSAVFYISNQLLPRLPQLQEAALPQCTLRLFLEKVSQLLIFVTLIP